MTSSKAPIGLLDRRVRAPATGFLVMAITILFVLGAVVPPAPGWIFEHLALYPDQQPQPAALHQLVTYALVQFDIGHWVVNMLGLLILGMLVEPRIGAGRFVLFLIAAAALAGMGHVVVYPQSTIGLMGASGVVAALLGLVLSITLPSRLLRYLIRVFAVLAVIALIIAAITGNQPLPQPGDAGDVAHVVGLAVGIIWGGLVDVRTRLSRV